MEEVNKKTPLTLTAKVVMFLAGFSNIFLGYAIYFVMYDSDREKANYFRMGARCALIIFALMFVLNFVLAFLGIDFPIFD